MVDYLFYTVALFLSSLLFSVVGARPGRAIAKTCKMVPWLPLYTLLITTLLDDKNWDMSVRMVTNDHPYLTHISLASFL